ncbi:MAG: (Fe-S)-binding protein [Bacteroidales bacterium]
MLNPASPVGEVCLFIDEFTNHNDLNAGVATATLLTRLGYRITAVPNAASARTYISKGFLRKARKLIIKNIEILSPFISETRPLVGIEPSAILGFRDEFPDLAGEEYRPEALRLSQNTFTIEEFIAKEFSEGRIKRESFTDEDTEVLVHVYCQEKAVTTSAPVLAALGIPANYRVREIPSGCCGMAGAFGYKRSTLTFRKRLENCSFSGGKVSISRNHYMCASNKLPSSCKGWHGPDSHTPG